MDFYKQLNYSLGNEDWHVEAQALRIKPGDRVLCVTASGDRPLNILTTDCEDVMSIDMNQSQTFLLELKLAALNHLDYEKYLAFLGCASATNRYQIFNELKPSLSNEAIHFWSQHKKMIERGILYQGKVERLTSKVAIAFKFLGYQKIKTLFSFKDVAEQRLFVQKHCSGSFFRKIVESLLHPKLIKLISNDPGLHAHVDQTIHPGKYIYQRALTYLQHYLARKSVLLQLIFLGRLLPDAYFPYLTYEGYKKIRSRQTHLRFCTDNIIEFLHYPEANQYDVFSMSDIASYMPQLAFEKLVSGICHNAKASARFCIREFMSKRHIPLILQERLRRDHELEKKLEQEESNFVYRFMVGEIR